MSEGFADLHIHSSFSDGELLPEEIVKKASSIGLSAISITDHDTINGLEQAIKAGQEYGIEVIPGIELSVLVDDMDVHILGYYIDYKNEIFVNRIKEFELKRVERAKRIISKLNKLGIPIKYESVLEIANESVVGRPHIANALLKGGFISSIREAFDNYIGYHCPAYVHKVQLSPQSAFSLIKEAGGIPVLAHPGTMHKDDLICSFIDKGLEGLEVVHPGHTIEKQNYYYSIANKYGLIVTGGTDYHGSYRGDAEIGEYTVPLELVMKMKERLGR